MKAYISRMLMELHPGAAGCGACPDCAAALRDRVSRTLPTPFPIDAVYTWVDGSDPEHARKRSLHMKSQRKLHENARHKARFRNNDELRYSLRSLERFAPWLRRIYLVTDDQIPVWLQREHPRICIADHRDFIPHQFLPTFNSHVIEAYLHRLEGLAEHYIYLNDDVFLARECAPTEFFTANGLPLAFTDWRLRRRWGYAYTRTPHAMSYFNTLRILKKRGVATDSRFIVAHGPFAQTRSNAVAAFAFYRDVVEGFSHNKFRTTGEIAFYSHGLPLWIYGQGKMIPCDARYYYVQTDRIDRLAYYEGIRRSCSENASPLFFCINDVGDQHEDKQWRADMVTLLRGYFSDPCSFETTADG